MTSRRVGPGAPAQNLVLVAEEDLGVLRIGERLEARVGDEVRARPLPDIAEHLHRAAVAGRVVIGAGRRCPEAELVEVGALAVGAGRGGLPLLLARQPLAGPARKAVGLLPGDVDHRMGGVDGLGGPHCRAHPAVLAVALPVQGRFGPGLGDELREGAVGHRRAVDSERLQLDAVAGALVVVGESVRRGADLVLAARHRHHLRPIGRRLGGGSGVGLGRLVALDHLQQLQHRLVVLVLVREQHLVDESVAQKRFGGVVEVDLVEDLQGALADPQQVGAQLVVAQDRQRATGLARVLDRVVEAAQLAVHRLAVADRLHQPELLEVGDVARGPRPAG